MSKKYLFLILLVALVLSPLAEVSPVTAQARGAFSFSDEAEFVPGELIVGLTVDEKGFPLSTGYDNTMLAASGMNVQIVDQAIDGTFLVLKFNNDEELIRNRATFANLPGVDYVERNGIMHIPPMPEYDSSEKGGSTEVEPNAYNPNDPSVGYQWHLDRIMYRMAPAPVATDVPCIVVIDTGVDYTHPDLAGKVYMGKDTIQNDMDPMDVQGHGTHVAGIAAGITNNSVGISGVSPLSNILAVRVLDDYGYGTYAQIANGIIWANNWAAAAQCGGQEPKIYNLSLGGPSSSTTLANAVQAAADKGRLVIAATGNNNSTAQFYPAAYPSVLAVSATEQMGKRAYFSNHGSWADIAAPGYKIWSTTMGAGYEPWNGTSMATPVVAGAAARVWSKYPGYTATQVRGRLVNTADSTFQDGFVGNIKSINLWAALGGGAFTTIQGQIFDAYSSTPLEGATVNVKRTGTTHCTTTTNESGFYSCVVPDFGMFYVSASKAGYVTDFRAIPIPASKHRFHANLALGRTNGTSTSDDWGVTLYWNGHQPVTAWGKEMDLYAVKLTSPPQCSSPAFGNSNSNISVGSDSYFRTFGQSEGLEIDKSFNGVAHIWVVNWDSGSPYSVNGSTLFYPSASYIAGSWARVHVYKNNKIIARVRIPFVPKISTYDNWYVGTINTFTGAWKTENKIRPNSGIPSCIMSPSP